MQSPTNPTALEFQNLLQRLGLPGQVVEFTETTRTAADAAAAIGCQVSQIVKSLIFKTEPNGQAVLVLTSGANRVDEALVASLVGEKLAKADAGFVRASTGFAIGGVPPFGFPPLAHTYLDQGLLVHEIVWAAAGTPNAVFPLRPAELAQHAGARVVAVAKEPG